MKRSRGLLIAAAAAAAVLSLYASRPRFGSGPPERLLRLSDRTVVTLGEVAREAADAAVVFMGEVHDRRSHHEAQLALLRELARGGRPLAVGLEMIQARRQPALDRWVAGEGSEEEIRRVFAEDWNFPWRLYREIFAYARERRIPLLGLNVDEEIPRQVARSGFRSLTPGQKRALPPVRCDVDETYEAFIRRALGDHAHSGASFVHFCEAQRVWDASMAWQVAEYLRRNPRRQVLVLAGSGHSWKRGIPDEFRKLSRAPFRVVLPPTRKEIDPAFVTSEDADYFWLGLG